MLLIDEVLYWCNPIRLNMKVFHEDPMMVTLIQLFNLTLTPQELLPVYYLRYLSAVS